jgi:mono/diheme cytochrome c family protein
MAVLAFVLLFVLLGLGALLLAFSGGRKGARAKLQTQSRRGRRGATFLFVLSILVLGVAVPAFVIASEDSRDSVPEASVAHLTDKQKLGRELFGQRCRNCHTLKAANATAKVGPTLDTPARPKALVLEAIEQGRAGGNGNMPAQVFEGEEAEAVAEFVAVASGGSTEDEPAD